MRACIVTPGYIASTPRVVREADALSAAGFDVRVVFTQGQLEDVRAFDDQVLAGRAWRWDAFRWSNRRSDERLAHFKSGVRHRIAQALPKSTWSRAGVAERAEGRIYPELAALAGTQPADIFIGHYPVGLAAAAHAARKYGASVGYDVEDLYAEIFPNKQPWSTTRDRIIALEERYVPSCSSITAVSKPVAEAFAVRYGVERPVAVHNCHPWADRDRMDGRVLDRTGSGLSLYWYSQTTGLDRGIQDAIKAAGLLPTTPQIHVRGAAGAETRQVLSILARECGIPNALHFHDACPPDELLSRAAEHDVGLALETDEARSRELSATNKIFLYMTAGLAIAATDLPGQRSVMAPVEGAGRLHRRGDWQKLASHLDLWQRDAAALAKAREASLDAARTRWNWELEGRRVVASVRRALSRRGFLAMADVS